MARESLSLDISYSQVLVCAGDMANPFNDWTDPHVEQGFAWRPGSVSFMTLDEAGPMTIVVTDQDRVDPETSAAQRIIRVPFGCSSVPDAVHRGFCGPPDGSETTLCNTTTSV
jgi:hypothetical protein